MLGGTADPLVNIQAQRDYEQTLRQSGSTVEAHFYQGGIHGVTYFGDFQDDAMRWMRLLSALPQVSGHPTRAAP